MAPSTPDALTRTRQQRPSAATAAAALGVVDALVFRRIGAQSWAHLGGLGRGEGWAGIIDIDEADDDIAFRIPHRTGEVHRELFAEPSRTLGPYDARAAATVRVAHDITVLLSNPTGPFNDADDAQLLRLAQLVSAEIDGVQPTKRLADELEILSSVREVMDTPTDAGMAAATTRLLHTAIRTLNCDIGVFRDAGQTVTVVGDDTVPTQTWQVILDECDTAMRGRQLISDDMKTAASARLAAALPGARATLAAPMPAPLGGQLLLIRTLANPSGFSTQCLRLVDNIIAAGTIVLRTTAMHDELRQVADRAVAAARTDPLTGLGNRLAWDEAIVHAQERADAGEVYSVVTVDVDGLKQINDRYGHLAGDDLLRRCAAIIREHCSPADIAVRMGGDEFAILVPHELGAYDDSYVAFSAALSAPASSRTEVSASVGVCTVQPGGSLFDAVREADMHMYANKRARRRTRAMAG